MWYIAQFPFFRPLKNNSEGKKKSQKYNTLVSRDFIIFDTYCCISFFSTRCNTVKGYAADIMLRLHCLTCKVYIWPKHACKVLWLTAQTGWLETVPFLWTWHACFCPSFVRLLFKRLVTYRFHKKRDVAHYKCPPTPPRVRALSHPLTLPNLN